MVLFTFCKGKGAKQKELAKQLSDLQKQKSDIEKQRLLNNNNHADTILNMPMNIPYEETYKDSKILDSQLQ